MQTFDIKAGDADIWLSDRFYVPQNSLYKLPVLLDEHDGLYVNIHNSMTFIFNVRKPLLYTSNIRIYIKNILNSINRE